MAPSVATSKTSSTEKDAEQKKEFFKNVKSKIRELNDYVAKNAEYTLSLHDALPISEERRVGKECMFDRPQT